MGERVMVMEDAGKGRLKRRWMDSVTHNLTERLSGIEAQERDTWRRMVRKKKRRKDAYDENT